MPHTYSVKWPLKLPPDDDRDGFAEDDNGTTKSIAEWLECCIDDALATVPSLTSEAEYTEAVSSFVKGWLSERWWLTDGGLCWYHKKEEICECLVAMIQEARRNEQPPTLNYTVRLTLISENARVQRFIKHDHAQKSTFDRIRDGFKEQINKVLSSDELTDFSGSGAFFVIVNGIPAVWTLESMNAALLKTYSGDDATVDVYYWMGHKVMAGYDVQD